MYKTTSKSLFNITIEGTSHSVKCRYSWKTGAVGIVTSTHKSCGYSGTGCTNTTCSRYLGIHVAERVLSKLFKNVEVMPNDNPGYDFVCNRGMKIDVKSASKFPNRDGWMFNISKNNIADYFLCVAFNNRDDLEPVYLWLIPGEILSKLITTSITVNTLDKWAEYKLDNKLDEMKECCIR